MKKISDYYAKLEKEINKGEFFKYSTLNRSWDKIVGEPFSNFTKIKDIIDKKILIEVNHSVGLNLIQIEKEKILKNLQKAYPELKIKEINFLLKK